jgi:hypothetical protein
MVTSRSIVNSPRVDYLWQTVFPEIAYKHSYVMHGLLSLSALHVAHLHPADRSTHLHVASDHHTLALRGLREDMNSICPDNADAVFASATLMFLYAFTTFPKLIDGAAADPAVQKSRILGADWIPLVHGIHVVIGPTYEYLKAGPLRSTLSLAHWDEMNPDVHPGPDDTHMQKLAATWRDDENKELYNQTLHLLRKANAWIAHFQSLPADAQDDWGYNRDWSAVSRDEGATRHVLTLNSRLSGSRSYLKSISLSSANASRWLCSSLAISARCCSSFTSTGGLVAAGRALLVSLTIAWGSIGVSGWLGRRRSSG